MSGAHVGLCAYVEATVRCADQCDSMLACEQEKRRALLDGDIETLERVLQRQQAAVMALEALEKKRLGAQEAAGFPAAYTAREVLSSLSESPERDALDAAAARLRAAADELQDLNRTAMDIAGKELQFQAMLDGNPRGTAGSATYKPGRSAEGGRGAAPSFEQEM